MPLALPLPHGHTITTSPLTDEEFRTTFGALGPGHKVWIEAAYRSTQASVLASKTLM